MYLMLKRFYFSLLISLFSINIASAEIITAETGGASQAAGIVQKNALHIEADPFTYFRNFENKKDFQYNIAATLLRYGLIDNVLELRFSSPGLLIQEEEIGFDNLNLGAKIKFNEETKFFPEINLISNFFIPVGDKDLRNQDFNHFYNFILGKNLIHNFSTTINIGPSFNDNNVSLPYVFSLGYTLNQKTNLFTEIFGSFAFSGSIDDTLGLATGFTHAFNDDFVLSFTNFWGFNEATSDLGLNLGLAYKIF